ncbi:hypothetical protein LSAT2_006760 [Lamellibrachia satsuma]|nr:hypothetical protein LSAT2_006760 [Lamellibrachia satsuma]
MNGLFLGRMQFDFNRRTSNIKTKTVKQIVSMTRCVILVVLVCACLLATQATRDKQTRYGYPKGLNRDKKYWMKDGHIIPTERQECRIHCTKEYFTCFEGKRCHLKQNKNRIEECKEEYNECMQRCFRMLERIKKNDFPHPQEFIGRQREKQFFVSLFHATPGNVSLPKDQKSKLRRYRKDLRMLMLKKTGLHKRKRILQKRCFLSALLVPLATSIPLPLVTILNRRRRIMQKKWHCWIFVFWRKSNRKFLLVLLSLYEMRDNLERGDLHEKGKMVSCNEGYLPSRSNEIFTVKEVHRSDRPVYRLIDYQNSPIEGPFYGQELHKVSVTKDKLYRVDNVLQQRKRGRNIQVLDKWVEYPDSSNS